MQNTRRYILKRVFIALAILLVLISIAIAIFAVTTNKKEINGVFVENITLHDSVEVYNGGSYGK